MTLAGITAVLKEENAKNNIVYCYILWYIVPQPDFNQAFHYATSRKHPKAVDSDYKEQSIRKADRKAVVLLLVAVESLHKHFMLNY